MGTRWNASLPRRGGGNGDAVERVLTTARGEIENCRSKIGNLKLRIRDAGAVHGETLCQAAF